MKNEMKNCSFTEMKGRLHFVQETTYQRNTPYFAVTENHTMRVNGEFMFMMTSSNGNIFRGTGHLYGEFTGPRWIPRTKASDAELWCFPWSAHE